MSLDIETPRFVRSVRPILSVKAPLTASLPISSMVQFRSLKHRLNCNGWNSPFKTSLAVN
jgi:hypothetical protein